MNRDDYRRMVHFSLDNFLEVTRVQEALEFELPEHAYGATGYIDGLKPDDLPAPIVRGTDRHGRKFVIIRYAYQKQGTGAQQRRTELLVLNQRYVGRPDFWVGGALPLDIWGAMNEEAWIIAETLVLADGGAFVPHKDEASIHHPGVYAAVV